VTDNTDRKKPGPKPKPREQVRTGRINLRVFPDVEAKAKRLGTPAVERLIRKAKEPK